LEEIVEFGRSWAYAPEIEVSGGYVSQGYDRSERIYQIKAEGRGQKAEVGIKDQVLSIKVMGSKGSPINNPAFYVKGWNGDKPKVFVDGKEFAEARIGIKHELEGDDLIVFLTLKSTKELVVEFK